MEKFKSAVTTAFEVVRIKSSEIEEGKYLFVGNASDAETYVTKNKPVAASQDAQPAAIVEEKPLTVAQIFNVSSDETRTTQESTYQPVKAVKAWGAKNRK